MLLLGVLHRLIYTTVSVSDSIVTSFKVWLLNYKMCSIWYEVVVAL